jgi:hypothetical protein
MKRFWIVGIIMILSVLLVTAGVAVATPAKRVARLSSSEDANAKGRAVLRVDPSARKVCFRITFDGTPMNPTHGSINRGHGYYSTPEVELFNNDDGPHSSPMRGCVRAVDHALLREIKEHPRRFSVRIFQYSGDGMSGPIRRAR